jgi:HSP20 family protein
MSRNKLLRYRPYSTTELITPFDSLLSELFNDNFAPLKQAFGEDFFVKGSYPKVNVVDTDTSVVIEAAVPGMAKEDISLEIKEDVLTISGKSNQDAEHAGGSFVRREIKRTRFERSFALSDNLDRENIVASCDNGVLKMVLPKISPEERAPQSQYIEIA